MDFFLVFDQDPLSYIEMLHWFVEDQRVQKCYDLFFVMMVIDFDLDFDACHYPS